jgi:hypothetical protein
MLLGLASGNTFLDSDQFSLTGDAIGTITAVSPDLAAVAKQAFYDFGERPMWAERITYGTGESCLGVVELLQLITPCLQDQDQDQEVQSIVAEERDLRYILRDWLDHFGSLS